MSDVVLAVTGASGSAYAVRLLEVLLTGGRDVHLVVSDSARQVLATELDRTIDPADFRIEQLLPAERVDAAALTGRVTSHSVRNFASSLASGSFRTAGMVICPCSMGTLASIANGLSSNLIHRAAAVHLKERRKLIVVPRETPLDTIQLENMARLSAAGAVILPAMPGFYHQPRTIDDLVDFVVARIVDQLGLDVDLVRRWGT